MPIACIATGSPYRVSCGERGTIIVLMAMLSAVLLLFVGLVVDSARISSAASEKSKTADQVALAALRTYISSGYSTHAAKMTAAVNAAEGITELNFLTSRWMEVQAQSGDLSSGTGGEILPGRWWVTKPDTCLIAACPCTLSSAATDVKGCFQDCPDSSGCENPDGTGPNLLASAMKVTLRTQSAKGIGSVFAGVLGQAGGGYSVERSGIAALRPRHTVFLIDLSRSSTYEYHLSQERSPVPNTPAEYTYRVTSATCPVDHSNPCLSPGSCAISSGSLPFDADAQWEALTETRAGTPPATTHFRSDYECYAVGSEHYLVDTYTNPFPLTNLLAYANAALTEWETYSNLHDRIGVIGYDEAVLPERTYPMMNTSSANFSLLKDITSDAEIQRENFFFPRDNAYSDLPEALDAARALLQTDPLSANAENSVVLFTAGLPSCSNLETGANYCSGTFATHEWALSESLHEKVLGNVAGRYQADGVSLSVVLAGTSLGAHSLMIKSNDDPAACMSDEELRRRNYLDILKDSSVNDQAKYGGIGNGTNQNYILPLYYLYSAARAVGGAFVPVRPACSGTCPKTASMNTACGSVAASPQNNPPATLSDPNDTGNYVIVSAPLGIQDASGRVLCDAECRTSADQVTDVFQERYKDPMIALVEESGTSPVSTTTATSTSTTTSVPPSPCLLNGTRCETDGSSPECSTCCSGSLAQVSCTWGDIHYCGCIGSGETCYDVSGCSDACGNCCSGSSYTTGTGKRCS